MPSDLGRTVAEPLRLGLVHEENRDDGFLVAPGGVLRITRYTVL